MPRAREPRRHEPPARDIAAATASSCSPAAAGMWPLFSCYFVVGSLLGGGLSIAVMFATWAANGGSYESSVTKGATFVCLIGTAAAGVYMLQTKWEATFMLFLSAQVVLVFGGGCAAAPSQLAALPCPALPCPALSAGARHVASLPCPCPPACVLLQCVFLLVARHPLGGPLLLLGAAGHHTARPGRRLLACVPDLRGQAGPGPAGCRLHRHGISAGASRAADAG